jgi:hypothetical protein
MEVVSINRELDYEIIMINGVSVPILPEKWVLINGIWRNV